MLQKPSKVASRSDGVWIAQASSRVPCERGACVQSVHGQLRSVESHSHHRHHASNLMGRHPGCFDLLTYRREGLEHIGAGGVLAHGILGHQDPALGLRDSHRLSSGSAAGNNGRPPRGSAPSVAPGTSGTTSTASASAIDDVVDHVLLVIVVDNIICGGMQVLQGMRDQVSICRPTPRPHI